MVDFAEPEYRETLKVENVCSGIKVPIQNFLNTGLSASCGKFIKMERGFLLYKGSSSEGSNGGPVVNNQKKLLGVSVGNFEDIEKAEKVKPSKDLVKFDIAALKEKIKKASRNYNIAIAINHPGLQNYLIKMEAKVLI